MNGPRIRDVRFEKPLCGSLHKNSFSALLRCFFELHKQTDIFFAIPSLQSREYIATFRQQAQLLSDFNRGLNTRIWIPWILILWQITYVETINFKQIIHRRKSIPARWSIDDAVFNPMINQRSRFQ